MAASACACIVAEIKRRTETMKSLFVVRCQLHLLSTLRHEVSAVTFRSEQPTTDDGQRTSFSSNGF
jgi:hypothetical protein